MSIWKKNHSLEQVNASAKDTLVSHLGIEIVEIGDDYIKGTMPVDKRTHQPMGILHGGASVVLAESIASIAGSLAADEDSLCVGLEINANHLAKISHGTVTAIAKPVHIGRSTQVWEIRINSELNKPVCISRITLAVLKNADKA